MKNERNDIYKNGKELNRYPSEILVSWVFRNRVHKYKKVLDIGCGFGNNLRFLIENGFDAYGIDNSDFIIQSISAEFNDRVSEQSIKSTSFNSESFDLLIDRQSIQHNLTDDLNKIFSECKRLLKKKSLMFSNFLLSDGNGLTKVDISEYLLDKNIIEFFFIK